MSAKRWLLFVLSGCLLSAAGGAQRHPLRQIRVADGLPSAVISDLMQSPDGCLLAATRAGVASYDGSRWTLEDIDDGLAWADQAALRRDADGHLWSIAAAAPFPVSRRTDAGWIEVTRADGLTPGAAVTGFEVLRGGDQPLLMVATSSDGLLLHRDGRWTRLGRADGLPDPHIRHLARWGDEVWLATPGGLAVWRDAFLDAPRVEAVPLRLEAQAPSARRADVENQAAADRLALTEPPIDVVALAVDDPVAGAALATRGSSLWLVADGGRILRLARGEQWTGSSDPADDLQIEHVANGLPFSVRRTAAERGIAVADRLGGLTFAIDGGVGFYHPTIGFEQMGPAHGLVGERVRALMVDREGSLWIAGTGLTQIYSRRFANWRRRDGLFADGVTALFERRDGTVVVGHRGGLSLFRDGQLFDTRSLPIASPDARRLEPVRGMLEHAGALWIAAGSSGLLALDDGGALRTFGAEAGIDAPTTALAVDGGTLLVGTEAGVLRRVGERFEPIGASPMKVRDLEWTAGMGDAALTAAAADGLHLLDDGRWQHVDCPDGPPGCESAFAVSTAPAGKPWAATAQGLYVVEDGVLRPSIEPRMSRALFFALDDTKAEPPAWWFGTSDGVMRWRPTVAGGLLEPLSVEQGLAGRETRRAAALVDRSGRVWVGTDSGLSIFRRALERPQQAPPVVALDSVLGASLGAGDEEWRADRPAADLTFLFDVVSLLEGEQVRVRARLEPFDEGWIETDQRAIRYTSLPPGRYVFAVQASSIGGAWSEVVRSPTITVPTPIWQRAWVWLLGLALAAALSWPIIGLIVERRSSQRLRDEVDARVAELSAYDARYRQTVRSVDDGLVTTDAERRVALLNPRAEEVLEIAEPDAVGRPLAEIMPLVGAAQDDGEPFDLFAARPSREEAPLVADLLLPSGERKPLEIDVSPLASDRRQQGSVVAFRDISRRRAIEKELARAEKLEAVGLLAGGIAHDFNNLLTVVLGNLSIARDARAAPADVGALDRAEAAILRARDLTQQLLTFSRGGAPVREAASIAEVLEESTAFVLSGSRVRAELDLADDLDLVDIDAGQINQVVNNLLINALQAMPDGGQVRVRARNVSAAPPVAAGPAVEIDIADGGPGIPRAVRHRVFEPYFSTKHDGRGLGLASAYSIVKQHDGLLTVADTGPHGTTFRIVLPASRVTTRVRSSDAAPAQPTERPRRRLLLMDDDEAVAHTTAQMLERLGFEVEITSDGRQTIARYREDLDLGRRFDVVMLDLTVPGGLGGREVMAELGRIDPDIRAIVYSGYSNDPVMANYLEHGFVGRIAKPFRIDDLQTVLDHAFEVPVGSGLSG